MTTNEDVRVTLAKDVIAALNAKRMIVRQTKIVEPRNDGYVSFDDYEAMMAFVPNAHENYDLRQFLSQRKCTVCAKGSLLVAAIDRFDKVGIQDFYSGIDALFIVDQGTPPGRFLGEYFSRKDQAMIEAAFECNADVSNDTISFDFPNMNIISRSICFGKKYDNYDDRLRAIMQNIIDNKGKFTP